MSGRQPPPASDRRSRATAPAAARRLGILGLIVALSAGFGALTKLSEPVGRLTGVEGLELQTLDWRQRITAESFRDPGGTEGSEIMLVFFDAASVAEWPYLAPFPRPVLAGLIEAISAAGARTIGLDVYLDRLYPELNEREGGDDRLREAIAAAGNVILVAPVEVGPDGPRLAPPHPDFTAVAAGVGAAELPTPFETIRDGVLAVRSGDGLEPSFALALWAHSRGVDVDSLLAHAQREGAFQVAGLPRARLPESWRSGGSGTAPGSGPEARSTPETGPAPGSGTAPGAASGDAPETAAAPGNAPLAGDAPAPATARDVRRDAAGGFALPFPLRFGPPSRPGEEGGTFPAQSASNVDIFGFVPEWFEDRIVLIGSGFHEQERFRSPFYGVPGPGGGIGGWTYGVEVHANALQGFLDGIHIRPLGTIPFLLLMIGLSLVAAGVVFTRGAMWGAGAGLLAMAGASVVAFWAYAGEAMVPGGALMTFSASHLWIPVVPPIISVFLSYAGSTAYVSVIEGREKRYIRSALGKYVSPAVADQISRSPESLKLGGQKRPLTILFSDLAGFTALSERLDPEELIALLNEYLSEMTAIVMEEDGTLDKYIGDAIMAFWNAPGDQADHADRALRCAIRMQERLAELNGKWAASGEGAPHFRVRIGINTGNVVVGNVGGVERFDYSVIGDAVNLAARLEPANDSYGTLIMTSSATIDVAAADRYRLRELDLIAVKGKKAPVRVHEVIGFRDTPLTPEREQALRSYDTGMEAWRRREWTEALEHFDQALEHDPTDGPSRIYRARALEHLAEPPAADWDFVVHRTVK